MVKSTLVILFFFLPILLFAEVWTYSYPDDKVKSSPFYQVAVVQQNKVNNSYTCFSEATVGDLERSSSWTTFSFTQEVEIEIEVPGEVVKEVLVRPKSKNIKPEIAGNKIRIELNEPQKLCVEVNGNKKKPLFIFADGAEENIPEMNEKGLWYFEPGMHNLGVVNLPDTVKHIYIAGGAYVRGAFTSGNRASNFKITGRGILCSPMNTEKKSSPIVELSGDGINAYIEGITLLGEAFGGIQLQQSYSTIRNCKFFAWNTESGGVVCGPHALIEDCFFRLNSDAVTLSQNFLKVQDCIFWQNEYGAPFQIGWNLQNDYSNFQVSNCDVICSERKEDGLNAAIFSAVHAGEGNLSNYLFENIRIEGDVYRLFRLTVRANKFDKDKGYGSISNLRFKNISLEGKCIKANEIWGYNPEHNISNIIFENLEIEGQKILNVDVGDFKINLNTVERVVFE